MRGARKGLIKAFILSAALTLSAALFIFSSTYAWFYQDKKIIDLELNPETFAVDIETNDIVAAVAGYRMTMSTVLAEENDEIPGRADFVDPYFNMAVTATHVTVTNVGSFSIYAGLTVSIVEEDGTEVLVNDSLRGLKCAVIDLDQEDLGTDVFGYKDFKTAIYNGVADILDENGDPVYPGGYVYTNQNVQLNRLNTSLQRRLLSPVAPGNVFHFIMVFWIDAIDTGLFSGDPLELHTFNVNINIVASDTNKPLREYP